MPAGKKAVKVMDLRGTYKGGGGPDKTILNSALLHDKSRADVLVTYLRDPEDNEFDIHLKAKKLGIKYIDVPDRKFLDLKCLSTLSALVREHGIRVLHAHDDKTLLYGWLLRLYNPGLAIMYTCHLHTAYGREAFKSTLSYYKSRLRRKAQIFIMNRFHKPLIAVSGPTRERLIKGGVRPQDIEVLHNCIDTGKWRREEGRPVLRGELGIQKDGFLVGTVARIAYAKDLPTFYEVARLVEKVVPKVTFVIAGDGFGSELEDAKKEVARLKLGHLIKFTGHRSDLLDVYSSLDVFLMTSIAEGFPNTLLEAMAMQVPVVSTSVDGVPELVVDGETGFLCEAGDAKGLSERIARLLADAGLRNGFSVKGRNRIVERFSFSGRVRKMEDYYERFAGM